VVVAWLALLILAHAGQKVTFAPPCRATMMLSLWWEFESVWGKGVAWIAPVASIQAPSRFCAVELDGSITLSGLRSSPCSLARLLCIRAEEVK
jgi:hypothetical protein